ncbi:MAG: glycoside hydrolase family 32 protein [Gordonia sp. (in: high G+C Gram-positive bacteria)]
MNSLHYAPPRNWMNDPNGLLHHNGRYHLFFQYNPLGVEHANLSWGHASSIDLITWENHPVAISFDDTEEIFSGSVVVDEAGTTGFGTPQTPAFIAFYTSMSTTTPRQAQSIAYSIDEGRTWTKYAGNPVLDRHSTDFRDPKVVRWHTDTESYWVMVAVEAAEHKVVFYRSDDLLSWEYLSEFGNSGAVGGVWECPDLFPLRVREPAGTEAISNEASSDDIRWVLLVSLNPGGIAGGSGTQYFIGDFDGRTFTPLPSIAPVDSSEETEMYALNWLDYGRDCYAGVTFSGLADDDRTLISWMSNWDYARQLPVDPETPQRGQMTLARRLSLISVNGQLRLRQIPIVPPVIAHTEITGVLVGQQPDPEVPDLVVSLPATGRIDLSVAYGGARGFVARLADNDNRSIVLTYDAAAEQLVLERRTGLEDFPPEFTSTERMPVAATPVITLTIWFDERAIEIYAENGTRVLTELLGALRSPSLHLAGLGGNIRIQELSVGAALFADPAAR